MSIPKIIWDGNTLNFSYELDNVVHYSSADNNQYALLQNGTEYGNVYTNSYVLEGDVRWISDYDTTNPSGSGWLYGWREFLEWAQQKNQFDFYPDKDDPTRVIPSYLVQPINGTHGLEIDGTRVIRLIIRNTSTSYQLAKNPIPPVPTSKLYPKNKLVLLLNNTEESYPGSGSVWYDISGNDIDFTLASGSISFSRDTGFEFNGYNTVFSASANSNYNQFFSGSAVSGSLTIAMLINPDLDLSAGFRAVFEVQNRINPAMPPSDNVERAKTRYKMAWDVSGIPGPINCINTRLYADIGIGGTDPTSYFYVQETPPSTAISASQESIILCEITSTTYNVYKTPVLDTPTYGKLPGKTSLMGSFALGLHSGSYWWPESVPQIIGASVSAATGGGLPANPYRFFFDGKIRGIMVYNRVLTNGEKTKVRNYLANPLTE